MGLLNPPRALPPIAEIIYGVLLHAKDQAVPKERLLALVAPASLEQSGGLPGSEPLTHTLSAGHEIGLFLIENDRVTLNPELPQAARDPGLGEASFRDTLRDLVMAPKWHDDLLWTTDKGARDLMRGLAWFLMQDPLRAPSAQWDLPKGKKQNRTSPPPRVQDLQRRQLGEQASDEEAGDEVGRGKRSKPWAFNTGARWEPFNRWAPYLGFAWRCKTGTAVTVLLPDPTAAVRALLPRVFAVEREFQSPEFLRLLSGQLPVIDGGLARTAIEERLLPESLPLAPPGTCSRSLSHALLRLEEEKLIRLEDRRGDSEKRRVYVSDRNTRLFSHVLIGGGSP